MWFLSSLRVAQYNILPTVMVLCAVMHHVRLHEPEQKSGSTFIHWVLFWLSSLCKFLDLIIYEVQEVTSPLNTQVPTMSNLFRPNFHPAPTMSLTLTLNTNQFQALLDTLHSQQSVPKAVDPLTLACLEHFLCQGLASKIQRFQGEVSLVNGHIFKPATKAASLDLLPIS